MNLDNLERLARAAAQGPYEVRPSLGFNEMSAVHCKHYMLADDLPEEDAAYLAALDPATILKLVAVARAAQRVLPSDGVTSIEGLIDLREMLEILNAAD